MKKIILFAVAAVLTASCTQTGKNGTVQQADERIDSLQRVLDQKDNELNDMMGTFNEIQEGFRLIEADEEKVSLAKAGEGASQPAQIRESMKNIQERMKHNKELIAKLQRQVREGSTRSAEFKKMVESLTKGYISSQLSDAVVFGILILVLLVKPAGILGKNVGEKV